MKDRDRTKWKLNEPSVMKDIVIKKFHQTFWTLLFGFVCMALFFIFYHPDELPLFGKILAGIGTFAGVTGYLMYFAITIRCQQYKRLKKKEEEDTSNEE